VKVQRYFAHTICALQMPSFSGLDCPAHTLEHLPRSLAIRHSDVLQPYQRFRRDIFLGLDDLLDLCTFLYSLGEGPAVPLVTTAYP
jgi:hypothetical protein